jgi:hypothetical protein
MRDPPPTTTNRHALGARRNVQQRVHVAAPATIGKRHSTSLDHRLIVQIWEQSRRTYGWRRVQAELADAFDHVANKKLVRAIMREQGINGLPKRRKGRRNMIDKATSTDLVNRVFSRDGPNMFVDGRHHRTPHPRRTWVLLRGARRMVPQDRELVD